MEVRNLTLEEAHANKLHHAINCKCSLSNPLNIDERCRCPEFVYLLPNEVREMGARLDRSSPKGSIGCDLVRGHKGNHRVGHPSSPAGWGHKGGPREPLIIEWRYIIRG